MNNNNHYSILRIILAIVACLVIVAIPLTVMLVTRDGAIDTPPIIEEDTPSTGGDNGAVTPDKPETHPDIEVSIVIDATALFGDRGSVYLDNIRRKLGDEIYMRLDEGHILDKVTITVPYGTTVLATTKTALHMHDIVLSEANGYISSIAGLSEKMAGSGSGWVYTINDEVVMVGAGNMRLRGGEVIKWKYIVGDRQ